jgi:hypothetical protein
MIRDLANLSLIPSVFGSNVVAICGGTTEFRYWVAPLNSSDINGYGIVFSWEIATTRYS